jgi:hypothetical protein
VRGQLTSLERATCGALVVIDVHARDVVADMAAKGVEDIRDFNWWVQGVRSCETITSSGFPAVWSVYLIYTSRAHQVQRGSCQPCR